MKVFPPCYYKHGAIIFPRLITAIVRDLYARTKAGHVGNSLQPLLTNNNRYTSTTDIFLSPSYDTSILKRENDNDKPPRNDTSDVKQTDYTLETSTGLVKKFDDISQTKGTPLVSGVKSNSTPKGRQWDNVSKKSRIHLHNLIKQAGIA